MTRFYGRTSWGTWSVFPGSLPVFLQGRSLGTSSLTCTSCLWLLLNQYQIKLWNLLVKQSDSLWDDKVDVPLIMKISLLKAVETNHENLSCKKNLHSNDQWIKVCAGPHPQFRCPIDDDGQWYLALPIPDSRLKCYVAGSCPYSMVEKFHKSNKISKFNTQNFLHTLFLTWKFPDYMMYMYTTFWYLCMHVCVLKFTHVW